MFRDAVALDFAAAFHFKIFQMMYSLSLILICIGVYLIVNTFRRFEKRSNRLTKFAEDNKKVARGLGATFLIASIGLLFNFEGFWATIFMWFHALTFIHMLIVLLNPIQKIKMNYAIYSLGFVILIELLLRYAS